MLGSKPGVTQSCVPGRDVGYMPQVSNRMVIKSQRRLEGILQEIGLFPEFSSFQLMVFFGILFRMPVRKIRERIHYLVELLDLPSVHKKVSKLR